jgi:PAS domain-containing protein
MLQLMERHEELARLLLDPADADQTRGASERATALTALRESEERFRTVVDLVPDLLWRIAPGPQWSGATSGSLTIPATFRLELPVRAGWMPSTLTTAMR